MPTVWISLKKSLHCRSEPSDVVDPKVRNHHNHLHLSSITRKTPRSGCSRSISNLKDVVIHGSKRHLSQPASCSPRSIGSSDFLNPITHEVIISNNSKCEIKITGFGASGNGNSEEENGVVGSMLRPGTPGPGAHLGIQYNPTSINRGGSSTSQRRSPLFGNSSLSSEVFGRVGDESGNVVSANGKGSDDAVSCLRCGEQFGKWQVLEAHHLSKHAVTELVEGDSSRKIVEIICRTSFIKSENNCGGRIERVLKVHNMQKTLSRFEEYREQVKIKASKLPKKHPRCLADGNELLRFYGTTMACSLGMNGSSSLCLSEKCNVCCIIKHGFSIKKGEVGVFTTSTSGRAYEMIDQEEKSSNGSNSSNMVSIRKALMVCRVIAGRVHKPLDNFQELVGQSGFDSLAGKVGLYSNIEELYLLNPKALLPCFVVICKT